MLSVPPMFEAYMTVNLQEVWFILIVLLDLVSCVVSVLGIFVRNHLHGNFSIFNMYSKVYNVLDAFQVFLVPLRLQIYLVVDEKTKSFWLLSLHDQVPDSMLELWVSVRSNTYEYSVV